MKINILADRLTWTAADGSDSRIKRLNLEANNGATGRIIWEYGSDNPRFLGENMTQEQHDAGKRAKAELMKAKLNKAASTADLEAILIAGGWDYIFPA